jgi:serine/threonine-protein kinase
VLGIGALVVGSIFVFTRPAHDAGASPPEATMGMVAAPSAAAAAAPRRDPPESASAAAAHTVLVQLSTSPEGAALFLDDKPIDNPFAGDYVPDATKHVLRAGAPGYVPTSREIVLDRDVKVVLPLVPVPARPALTANPHRAPVAAAQPAPRTVLPPRSTVTASNGSNGSNCTPPFYFDAQGIKKLRPECL